MTGEEHALGPDVLPPASLNIDGKLNDEEKAAAKAARANGAGPNAPAAE